MTQPRQTKISTRKTASRKLADGGSKHDPASTEQQTIAGLRQLLTSEDQIRSATDETELAHLIVNETRKLVGARQVFLLQRNQSGIYRVSAVSSLALVDRDTPLVRWIEAIVATLTKEGEPTKPSEFALPAFAPPQADETSSYPFPEFVWQPLGAEFAARSGTGPASPFAALLCARERAWLPDDLKLLNREAAVYANSWAALKGQATLQPKKSRRGYIWAAALVATLVLACVPVPLTTLAPVEIVAHKPEIITAPIDGVIKIIPSEPNRKVTTGTVLFRYEDTELSNRLELAERQMQVAQSRYERTRQAAVSDSKARHELLITKTEFELKKAERNYAKSLQDKVVVRSTQPGLLIYSSRSDLLGRPVATGEKIMSVARPGNVEARIELPVADAIALSQGAEVRLFLDASPLNALTARITSESYHAEPNSSNQLVYALQARLENANPPPRIGARGTAQVYGATVPLGFFLLRRPIAFARQTIGL